MNDFKIGDKVRIIAAEGTERYKNGDILTVSGTTQYDLDSPHVFVTCADGKREMAYLREIEPYTPDVITINRADLPEVVERGGVLSAGSGPEECVARGSENPNWLRNRANSNLALADFIEARDKAAEEAEHTRGKRRDELAELFSGVTGTRYGLRNRDLRNAIDHIIDLEASHD